MINPLTDCDPTVTHSDITAAGVVEAKVKSIGSCTRSNTGSHNGVCSSYKLIGYAGKINRCSTTAVDPSILNTHNRHIGIGNSGSSVPSQNCRRYFEKIYRYNPKRYYILTTLGIKEDDYDEIISRVHHLKMEHGCQLIINGLLPTLKYYLSLVDNLEEYLNIYSESIVNDSELKIVHKKMWVDIQSTLL